MILSTLLLALVAAQTPAEPQAAPTPKPKMICRVENETSTRIRGKRRCMTAADWAAQDDASGTRAERDRNVSRTPNG